jgi:hypothetical protein
LLLLGAALIASCIAVAHFAPHTFHAAFVQMRVLTALGGALLGTALPGLIGIEFKGVRAIGAASFVVLFFLFTPLDLASMPENQPERAPELQTETQVNAVTEDKAPAPAATLPEPADSKAHYQNSPVCRGDNCQQNTTFNQQQNR